VIQSVLTFTLEGRNEQLDPILDVFQTVFVQRRSVTASIALASYSQGFENWQPGWAGAFITKAGVAVGPNRTDNLPLDPRDVSRTQLHIKNCVFVTFRMVIAKAEARATAHVFVEDAEVQLAKRVKSVYLFDRDTAKVKGIHHVAFPEGAALPSDKLVMRRVRDCAADSWKLNRRQLETALADSADPMITSQLSLVRKGKPVLGASDAPTFSQLPSDIRSLIRRKGGR
jgi:hypothetical protein